MSYLFTHRYCHQICKQTTPSEEIKASLIRFTVSECTMSHCQQIKYHLLLLLVTLEL